MDLWSTVWLSIKIAFIASVLVMLCATLLAKKLIKTRSILAKIIELLIYVPMAMPPVALGYGLLLALGPNSFLGSIFHKIQLDVAFTFLGAVLASFVASLGIGLRIMKLAFLSIPKEQKEVAEVLGASEWQIFYHICWPQSRQSFMAGLILVFIRALGEFGATMILVGSSINGHRTLAMAIWVGMEMPDQENLCFKLVLISVFLSVLALISAELVKGKER
jgi:molybdate transport system permease protein